MRSRLFKAIVVFGSALATTPSVGCDGGSGATLADMPTSDGEPARPVVDASVHGDAADGATPSQDASELPDAADGSDAASSSDATPIDATAPDGDAEVTDGGAAHDAEVDVDSGWHPTK